MATEKTLDVPILISHDIVIKGQDETIEITMLVRTNNKKTPLFFSTHLTDKDGAEKIIAALRKAIKDTKLFRKD